MDLYSDMVLLYIYLAYFRTSCFTCGFKAEEYSFSYTSLSSWRHALALASYAHVLLLIDWIIFTILQAETARLPFYMWNMQFIDSWSCTTALYLLYVSSGLLSSPLCRTM